MYHIKNLKYPLFSTPKQQCLHTEVFLSLMQRLVQVNRFRTTFKLPYTVKRPPRVQSEPLKWSTLISSFDYNNVHFRTPMSLWKIVMIIQNFNELLYTFVEYIPANRIQPYCILYIISYYHNTILYCICTCCR